jgi:hypothetical protein
LFLPDSVQKKELEGEVIAVGPGAVGKDGARIQMVLKTGDRVLLPEYGGHELELGSEVSCLSANGFQITGTCSHELGLTPHHPAIPLVPPGRYSGQV